MKKIKCALIGPGDIGTNERRNRRTGESAAFGAAFR